MRAGLRLDGHLSQPVPGFNLTLLGGDPELAVSAGVSSYRRSSSSGGSAPPWLSRPGPARGPPMTAPSTTTSAAAQAAGAGGRGGTRTCRPGQCQRASWPRRRPALANPPGGSPSCGRRGPSDHRPAGTGMVPGSCPRRLGSRRPGRPAGTRRAAAAVHTRQAARRGSPGYRSPSRCFGRARDIPGAVASAGDRLD